MERNWLQRNGWQSLFAGMLTVIMTGVGYLIVQNNTRLDRHETRIESLELITNDLRNISSNLVEAYNDKVDKDKQQDQEILELWKCSSRGGKTTVLK